MAHFSGAEIFQTVAGKPKIPVNTTLIQGKYITGYIIQDFLAPLLFYGFLERFREKLNPTNKSTKTLSEIE